MYCNKCEIDDNEVVIDFTFIFQVLNLYSTEGRFL